MNFFDSQDKARSLSFRLSILFIVAVILTFLTLHLFISAIYSWWVATDNHYPVYMYFITTLHNPLVWLADIVVIGGMIVGGAMYRLSELKTSGVKGVVESLGGTALNRGDASVRNRRLYNVVEEMAIASGTPVPQIFILEDESGINACAIGTSTDNAAICVTAGALDLLSRDELQGIVAHEFSHIVNSDVRLNMRLIGILFGIEIISIVGLWVARISLESIGSSSRSSSSGDKKGAGLGLLLIALAAGIVFLVGLVGQFFGNIIRAAISRQREFLADASAVEFTRNPQGLEGALKKIGTHGVGSAVRSSGAEQASHMFFSSVFSSGVLRRLYYTHPELASRIRAIDPTFDGVFPERVEPTVWDSVDEPLSMNFAGLERGRRKGENESPRQSANASEPNVETPENVARLSASKLYGDWTKGSAHSGAGGVRVEPSLLETPPTVLDGYLRNAAGAKATLYACVLSGESEVASRQRETVAAEGSEFLATFDEVAAIVAPLSETVRLLATRQALPLLRLLPPADYGAFRQRLLALCRADGKISLFEYTVATTTLKSLDTFFRLSAEPRVKYSSVKSVRVSLATAVACLAVEGAQRPEDAQGAYESAMTSVGLREAFNPDAGRSLEAFTTSLNELACASPQVKKEAFRACWTCIMYDKVVTERESAMLSAVAAALGVPAPVWRATA